jgi:hypothetical protein
MAEAQIPSLSGLRGSARSDFLLTKFRMGNGALYFLMSLTTKILYENEARF